MTTLKYPDITLPDGDMRYQELKIDEKGELQFETTDFGEGTAELAPNGGDSDYEYWVYVAREHVDNLTLELIKDRFKDSGEFREWLNSKNIPSTFYSY